MIGAAFFRLSPQLSVDVVLDETDDDKLLLVLWETMVYLHRNQAKVIKIANTLNLGSRRPSEQSVGRQPMQPFGYWDGDGYFSC